VISVFGVLCCIAERGSAAGYAGEDVLYGPMRTLPRSLWFFGTAVAFWAGAARADIPTGYTGKPFDPAVAGGQGIIPSTVKAGPYTIPGRLDFVNYDMGPDQVAFHAGDKITTKAGAGYRTGSDVATFSKTSAAQHDVWYMSGTATDGTTYPDATTQDFYIGAVQVNDWFNFTVNVQTAGTYNVSSTWSSGNGPPGGEGGDGAMGLQIYSNGAKLADWKSTWPDFNTTADFHHWKPYPNFTQVTLPAGLQVIKLESTSKHLNLDYVQFDLVGTDGGTSSGAAGASDGGGAGAGGATGATGAAGSGSGAAGSGATGAGTAGSGAAGSGAAGAGTGGGTTSGTAGAGAGAAGAGSGAAGSGAAGTGGGVNTGAAGTSSPPKKSSGGCAVAGGREGGWVALALSALVLGVARRRPRGGRLRARRG
jgi:hypothetical protein